MIKSPSQPKGAIWQWKADFSDGKKQLAWLSQPLDWFENWLREQPPRELDLAREFAQLDSDARSWAPFVGPQERWKTLVPALQTLAFDESAEKASSTWRLNPHGRFVVAVPGWVPVQTQRFLVAQKLLAMLATQLPLQFHKSRWRGIGVRGKEQPHAVPTFTASAPSQHERLEAALLWRDFGREIGKSDEVEAALRQLLTQETPNSTE